MRRPPSGDVRTVGFLLRGSARKAFIGLFCMLVLLVLKASAEQPEVQAKRTRRLQGRGAETTASQSLWQTHSNVASPGNQTAHGSITPTSVPFIRPIAPMPPMFPNDDLLRVPWSSFGLHPTPVRFHSRPVAALQRDPMKPRVELNANPVPPMSSSDLLSSLARLVSNHAMLPLPRPNSAATPEPLTSSVMPQTGISPARATQIQAALVHYGYLAGTPTGSWDAASIAAMRKLQSDHRWQTKFMPDARALIFLGLGPGSETP